jgi:hypothetical protein
MLVRICLIIAILAGISATVVGIVKVKPAILALQEDRDKEKKMKEEQTSRAVKAEKNYSDEQAKLKREKSEHDATRAALGEANNSLADARRRGDQLTADLDKAKTEKIKAQQELSAYLSTGKSPEAIGAMIVQVKLQEEKIKVTETERDTFRKKLVQTEARLKELLDPSDSEQIVPLPPGLKGKVLAVDPKWDFVVLDIGENQGAAQNGVMLVNRGGHLIAKVKLKKVEADRSIANVLPTWKLQDVVEGDQVMH